jgi:fused signal recognition particle receptor
LSLWNRFRQGLERTRERLTAGLGAVLTRRGPLDDATRAALEEALLGADVGPATTEALLERAALRVRRGDVDLRTALEAAALETLGASARFEPGAEKPWVALLVGVNGVGKTTLAGKLAARFARDGRRTLLVAADTFRAAATEQLEVWAARAGVEIVTAGSGSDPASVVHDALRAALARGVDVVLVDTAGRLHTKQNLMAELEKVARVCARLVPGAPHHVLLVLDATLGQNGLAQAREFQRATPITSLALTKLDGTARGGALLAIAEQLGLPISLVGLGEGVDDWEPFDAQAFARGLFEGEPVAG